MSIVHLQNVEIINSHARFSDPYIFKVTFECISPLEDDIEWKLIYVGSAESEKYDQELDSCMVGPVPVGVNSFEFEAEAPSPEKIPASDLLGVTVILLTASYKDAEFIRVGYYVNNDYESEELRENPPEDVQLDKVCREVLASKPRVTRFNINWDNPKNVIEPSASETKTTQTQEGEAETVETTPKPMYRPESELSQGGSAFVPL
ncbi:Histone chaperone ASF1 [Malassezia restricta CBS 7877]|uniref:Anti-silencing function protein 1 n=1 Tax=Malassezia restricta (strain ATCC 96810 / NBRC 103918 / CBS 7877) TaxID=425264 RepID=A0A3G2S8A2_MALR7|nr:Histone chaperone ASF1 [Malassezia restricta CBS 7877]